MISYALWAIILVSCDKSGPDDIDEDGVLSDVDCDDEDAAVGGPTQFFGDADGDGFGRPTAPIDACGLADGLAETSDDCNDADPAFFPGAPETDCTDLNDYNCDGSVGAADADGDRFFACEECDDANPMAHPGQVEICNTIDDDCDGDTDEPDAIDASTWYNDVDGDGFGDTTTEVVGCQPASTWVEADGDCDDDAANAFPYAPESCTDAIDLNCDGSPGGADADGDGFFSCDECDDSNKDVNPDGLEVCNGLDDDCDGTADNNSATDAKTWYLDADRDGFGDPGTTTVGCAAPANYVADGTDCDDLSADVNPGAIEICDSDDVDEDCSGLADDADADVDITTFTAWYADADGDLHADPTDVVSACDAAGAYTYDTADDCDDDRDDVNPDMDEVCDADDADEDCSGFADDDDSRTRVETMSTWYNDADEDGHANPDDHATYCDANGDFDHATADDCDDDRDDVNPDMIEICDAIDADEDCSGKADDADTGVDPGTLSDWYADEDADGHADPLNSLAACDPTVEYAASTADDCDDTRSDVSPSEKEICDVGNTDEDCDSKADDSDSSATGQSTWYADGDGDLYADPTDSKKYCDAQGAYTFTVAKDCNDDDIYVNPGAAEVCDASNVDENCNTYADNADSTATAASKSTFYVDTDGDTYGDATYSTSLCDATTTYSTKNATDCDDSRTDVNPGVTEVCDSLNTDENCNGTKEDADTTTVASTKTTFYADTDGDGSPGTTGSALCDATATYKYTSASDCDDSSSAKYPEAPELCDGAYNDCTTSSSWTVALEDGKASKKTAAGVWSDQTTTLGSSTAGLVTAAAGDTVYLCSGTFYGRVSLTGAGATLKGKGSTLTTLDGKAGGTVVTGSGSATSVSGLKITNGTGTLGALSVATTYNGGGGLLATGSGVITADDLNITGNTAGVGGGVGIAAGATLNLSNSTISSNTATYTGYSGGGVGMFGAGSKLYMTTVTISNNTGYYGGGIDCESSCGGVVGTGVTFKDNTTGASGGYGAAMYFAGTTSSPLSLPNVTVTGNKSAGSYGGFYSSVSSGTVALMNTVDLSNATFSGNSAAAGSGGGLYLSASGSYVAINLSGATITTNTSSSSYGGLYFGGVSSTSTANLSDIKITNNTSTAGSYGGAYFSGPSASATLNLTGATITGNTAAFSYGGAFFSSSGTGSTLTLTNANISSNTATSGPGGGLSCSSCLGTMNLTGATINGNNATTLGGGLYLPSSTSTTSTHTITMSGTTVTGNKVTQPGTTTASGGGLYLSGASATLNIGSSSNISNNSVSGTTGLISGGGLEVLGSAKVVCSSSAITGNSATVSGTASVLPQGGGARISAVSTTVPTSLTSTSCDWGTDGATGDNAPTDMQVSVTAATTNEYELPNSTTTTTCSTLSTGGSCI